jgi:hypothetical protein
MADIVTGTVTGQVDVSQLLVGQADIRRETQEQSADIRREAAIDTAVVSAHVKEAGWQTLNKIADSTDRVTDQDTAYFIAGQSVNFQNATALASLTASTNANFNQTLAAIQLSSQQTVAASQLAAAQNAAATALASAQTQQLVVADGNVTRALINSQTVDELRFRNLERDRDHGHQGHGCKDGVFSFGPPLGATYPT